MGVWKGPMGSPVKFIGQDDFTFSGTSQYASSGANWEIAFKASGTLKFKKNPGPIDVFLVGGGQNGEDGYKAIISNTSAAHGGDGGDGGKVRTVTGKAVSRKTDYQVVIGSAGADSSFWDLSSASGTAKEGGEGSTAYTYGGSEATKGTDGSLAFGEAGTLIGGNTLFGASGGGGGSMRGDTYASKAPKAGGTTGAGAGGGTSAQGGYVASNGGAATANTGAGGGGGGAIILYTDYSIIKGNGGAGASGIIIIRNHRE